MRITANRQQVGQATKGDVRSECAMRGKHRRSGHLHPDPRGDRAELPRRRSARRWSSPARRRRGPGNGRRRPLVRSKTTRSRASGRSEDGRLRPERVTNKLTGATIEFDPAGSECFVLGLASDKRLAASEMKLVGEPRVERIEAEPGASCLARRSPGVKIVADFVSPDGEPGGPVGGRFARRIELRPAGGDARGEARAGRRGLAGVDRPGASRATRPAAWSEASPARRSCWAISSSPTNTPTPRARSSRRGRAAGRKSFAASLATPRSGPANRRRKPRRSASCPRASCAAGSSTTSNASERIPIGPRCTTTPGTTSPGRATG